jgi:rhodanese-related sulfurtransferase
VIAMPVEDLHARIKEGLPDNVQLMDVREPNEVEKASLPGFKVYPLSRFGEWAPTLDLDPKKETIVMVRGNGFC